MRRLGITAGLLLAFALPTRGDDLAAPAEHDVVSEIGLARLAEELGDLGLAARLTGSGPRAATLAAVRASVHAGAPENLVPALAQLACGRDPALAPEAAFALLALSDRLRASELAAREVLTSDLRAARDALGCAQRDPLPRADLALALARVAAQLDTLLR